MMAQKVCATFASNPSWDQSVVKYRSPLFKEDVPCSTASPVILYSICHPHITEWLAILDFISFFSFTMARSDLYINWCFHLPVLAKANPARLFW